MDNREKSIALAKMMKWLIFKEKHHCYFEESEGAFRKILNPYADSSNGLAQFAAILLKNIEIFEDGYLNRSDSFKPTQANILDEILRINGTEA